MEKPEQSAEGLMGGKLGKVELIVLIAALMALNALAVDIMLPALPAMGAALKVAHANQHQLVLTVYLVGFGIAQLFFGPLSDRYGRRGPLMLGIVVYVVAAGLAAIAPNFEMLLILRFIQGLGAAATRVISQSFVRDRFGGRAMAEVMSLVFMVFMVIPVLAPSVGQVLLFSGHWQMIFLFMAVLALVIGIWAYLRLDESLPVEKRRALSPAVVLEGFRLVFSNRLAMFYGLSGTFVIGGLFGFLNSATQIYLDIYKIGAWFPVAFGAVAALMAVSSFLNSRLVGRFGMRRMAHSALIVFIVFSGLWMGLAIADRLPFAVFFAVLATVMFCFGLVGSNTSALAMEPLGAVAGTASSVFGFIQTVGGALIGVALGFLYDGTVVPIATGYFVLGLAALCCVLIAEKGHLFGVGAQYKRRE
jgi:DHA1 family bicyclomycin/chloramphenicol resistance-like MFS transporter